MGVIISSAAMGVWAVVSRNALSDHQRGNEEGEHMEDLEQKLDSLLRQRLDAMVHVMKEQIPMVGALLSQSREEKLKSQAYHELVKIIPEIRALMPIHAKADAPRLKWFYPIAAGVIAFGGLVGWLAAWLLSP